MVFWLVYLLLLLLPMIPLHYGLRTVRATPWPDDVSVALFIIFIVKGRGTFRDVLITFSSVLTAIHPPFSQSTHRLLQEIRIILSGSSILPILEVDCVQYSVICRTGWVWWLALSRMVKGPWHMVECYGFLISGVKCSFDCFSSAVWLPAVVKMLLIEWGSRRLSIQLISSTGMNRWCFCFFLVWIWHGLELE